MIQKSRLKLRIITGTLLVLLICCVSFSLFFLNREQHRLESEIQARGEALAKLVAQFSALPIEKYSFFIVQEVARNVEEDEDVAFCEIYDANDKSLVQIDTTIHGIPVAKKSKPDRKDILTITTPISKDGRFLGTVELGLELAPVHREIQQHTLRLALGILALLTLVGIIINIFFSYAFVTPVVTLSAAVKNLGRGEFDETKIATRNDEIGDLARTFNEMSGSLKQLYQDLEKKVEERTADLATTNERLEHEIAVREKTEEELKSAKEVAEQANQYKSNFIANMSHEIRTPLNAILGYAQILQGRSDLDSQTRKAIEAIDKGGSHLLGIINDILDLSKIEAGRMELKPASFDLCLLLRSMSSLFQLRCADKSLTWEVVGIDTMQVLPVIADAGKLRQILINLLGNAVKFTTKGGVTLRISRKPNDLYRFCIEDTGPGVPEHDRQKIFEPFSELSSLSDKEGTGLGLSITTSFLEMMGSHLEIRDNTPQGSRFCFTLVLPVADKSSLPVESPQDKIEGLETPVSLTALVVDDDKLSRSMLSHLLKKNGISSIEAENGVIAMTLLKTSHADIIFMDRYMPEMDGMETINAIKRDYGDKAPPIVMITAAAFDSDKEAYEELGIDGIIIKPLDIRQVFRCISKVLNIPLKMEKTFGTATAGDVSALNSSEEHFQLPSALHQQLATAAEFGNISKLKDLLQELRDAPQVSDNLADRMQHHLERYELSEIVTLLDKTEQL